MVFLKAKKKDTGKKGSNNKPHKKCLMNNERTLVLLFVLVKTSLCIALIFYLSLLQMLSDVTAVH